MRRRELLAALSAAGATLGSGCLASEAAGCAPSSRWGLVVENDRAESRPMRVAVRRWGRTVFSDAFDVPAATEDDDGYRTRFHPTITYEPDVFGNLRSYDVSVRYDGRTHEYSFRAACSHLHVRIMRNGDPAPVSFATMDHEKLERHASNETAE